MTAPGDASRPAWFRVLLHGRRSPGRLDAVSGLLTTLRRMRTPVLHVDDAVEIAALGAVLRRFRPHILLQLGPEPALTAAERDLVRTHDVLALGWQQDVPASGREAVDDGLGQGLDLFASTGVRASDADRLHVPPGARWLPPAVDATLLDRPLPPLPGPRHDVLVLGHATARPRAHALAACLVKRFSAATYGPGWPEAWGGSPDGAHLLQVLRHGRIHVHVTPGTGPLLSLAAGGVLAVPAQTAVSEQLADFGPEEVVRFGDADDAAGQVRSLLDDPRRLDAMRLAARERLLSAHTYEHRWVDLAREVERRADVGEGLPDRELAARAVARSRGGSTTAAPRRVVVSGWYGAGNTGDDLILESLAHRIETEVPSSTVVVAARYPRPVLTKQGLEAFDRTDRHATEEHARRATAVLLGAGGLWEDYTFLRNHGVAGLVTDDAVASVAALAVLPLLADVHRRPVHVVGVGAGPLSDPGAQAVVRHVGKIADSVTVRDVASRELLEGIPGWTAPVEVAPDVVYALEPGPLPQPRVSRSGGRPLVAVNLRPWGEDDAAISGAVEALGALATHRDALLVGVPLSPQDAARLAAVLPATGADHVLLDAVGGDLAQLLADLGGCDVLLSMRLHGCLLAHRAGTPVVGLGYDPKVAAHFAELGRERFVVPLSHRGDALLPLLEEALDAGLPAAVRDVVRTLERRAAVALTALSRRIADVEPPPEPLAELPWLDDDVPGRLTLPCAPGDVSGSSTLPGRRPGVLATAVPDGLVLSFADARLQAGDVVAWSGLVPAVGGGSGRRIQLTLASPNLEDRGLRGRLVWQVRANGRVLVTEDVASWSEDVSIWLGWGPAAGDVRLEVRVVVLADCEGREWRRASGLHLRRVVASAWPGAASLGEGEWVASCSSPRAAVLT